ncbi:MAG: hypothetical protein HY537_16290, partial [Deltaproteobacteria bacterium]|nr:hypothetical protein [Deltaproteobacteria bacterium]
RIALSNEQLRLFIPISRQAALLLKNAQALTRLRSRERLAAVGEMAAGLAHEIKNPLGAIKGAAELLKGNVSKEADSEFLEIILDETDRLSSVLSDFLDYAKPRRVLPQTSCDPMHVIDRTASMILRDSKVSLDIRSEWQGLIEADPEVLKQVLLNLILNAVQATEGMDDRRIEVWVREAKPKRLFAFADAVPIYKTWEGWNLAKAVSQKSSIEIEVKDNGCGIPPEDLPRIFQPFYTTKPKGTGLGLAICQRLIEGMGGHIHVKPNKPHGTIFAVRLPVRRDGTELSGEVAPSQTVHKDLAL